MKDVEFFIIIGISVSLLLLSFIISFLLIHQRRQLQYRNEKLQLNSTFQQTLLRTQLEIQEQTFKAISQEIHDNIGQVLTVTKLNLNTLSGSLVEKDRQKIDDAIDLLTKTIKDLRDLSKSLNTEAISNIGLRKAIENELKLLEKTGTMETSFELIGEPFKINPENELILFRIVQEALHNIIKHADARKVEVIMNFHDQTLKLDIADDGIGFAHKEDLTSGSGLKNMESRAKIIGATFTIESGKGHGTRIKISLP